MVGRSPNSTSLARTVIELNHGRPGRTSLAEMIGNALILTTMEQVAELLVFSDKAGLGVDVMQKVLAAIFPGAPLRIDELYANQMVRSHWLYGDVSGNRSKDDIETETT